MRCAQAVFENSPMTSEQIKEIAEILDCGLRCFVHRSQGNITTLPDENTIQDFDHNAWKSITHELHKNSKDYVEIVKMDSAESFKVIERFIKTITDEELADRLLIAINKPKPFRNFKYIIDNSASYRQGWFEFKASQLENWVKEQLIFNGL